MRAEGGEGVREVVRERQEVGAEEVHFFVLERRLLGFWWVCGVCGFGGRGWWFWRCGRIRERAESRRAEDGILGCKVKSKFGGT